MKFKLRAEIITIVETEVEAENEQEAIEISMNRSVISKGSKDSNWIATNLNAIEPFNIELDI